MGDITRIADNTAQMHDILFEYLFVLFWVSITQKYNVKIVTSNDVNIVRENNNSLM